MSFDPECPFDPFGDFESRGYLRNTDQSKDPWHVCALEHRSFLAHLDSAIVFLREKGWISYEDVLATHQMLFSDFYRWAGQDRLELFPNLDIRKGPIKFASPTEIPRATEYGLQLGQKKGFMSKKPGEVLGYLAFAHPFLEGNGRTLLVVHTVLAERAGISIDWASSSKLDFLTFLGREIEQPGQGHLDSYLQPLLGQGLGYSGLGAHVARIQGLRSG